MNMNSSRIGLLLTLVSSAALFACSGDNSTDDAGSDATTDVGQTKDSAPDTTASDSGGGNDATPGDAGDGGVIVAESCTAPTACDAGSPFCCATVALNGGTPPDCSVASITSACAAQCNTVLQFSCTANETVRLCSSNSDCTEPNDGKCCTFKTGAQTTTFCANAQIAASVDAGCM